MTHEQAFLQAIIETPADDTPRLVYADWLEERGQPGDAERAEFIRVQCELAKAGNCLSEPPYPECPKCLPRHQWCCVCNLRSRERSLIPVLRDQCRAILPKPSDAAFWHIGALRHAEPEDAPAVYFDRGFVHTITLCLADFIQHGRAIVQAPPVEVVRITDWEPFEIQSDRMWTFPILATQRPQGEILKLIAEYFPSKAAAETALSAASLAWARAGVTGVVE